MKTFNQWIEEKANIRIVGTSSNGEIIFAINGKRYTYIVDAAWFNKGTKFHAFMVYAPGKALNLAKKYGRLIDPMPKIDPQKQLF